MHKAEPDPIIAEAHTIRDECAARFKYGSGSMFRDIRAT